jgi:acyl carrier protein
MIPASNKTEYLSNTEDPLSCGVALMNKESCLAVGDVEAALTVWWQELLAVDQVTPMDDFFELGGHSLIGVALFARIKKTYGIDLGLATLFEARTVRQLAEVIAENWKSKDSETN